MSLSLQKRKVIQNRQGSIVPFSTQFLNKLPRSVGVEYDFSLEEEKLALFSPFKPFFSIGLDDHKELRSVPAKGDRLITTLVTVANLAKLTGRKESYNSYGYHVHVDGLDLGTPAILRILYTWQYIEDYVWKKVVHRTRQNTGFAFKLIPIPPTDNLEKTGLKTFCTGEQINQVVKSLHRGEAFDTIPFYSTSKDTWWVGNISRHSVAVGQLYELGTIEFRVKEATGSEGPFEDLLMWPLFCGWLVETLSDMDDRMLVSYLNPNYTDDSKITNTNKFLQIFLPEFVFNWFINHANEFQV